MSTIKAAFIPEAKGRYEVRDAPMPTPWPDEVVVKAAGWAINPVDYKLQKLAFFPLEYPMIPGSNIAGEIVAVGKDVTALQVGDRVAAQTQRAGRRREDCGAFAAYACAPERLTFRLPPSVDFAHGLVYPSGILTAAAGLYDREHFGLPLPMLNAKPINKTLLVWGAASAVGSGVVQMARHSGLDVVATASPANHEIVKSMGARHVVDYKSSTVEEQLVALLKDTDVIGAFDCVGPPTGATLHCAKVLEAAKGGKTIVTVLPTSGEVMAGFTPKMVSAPSVSAQDFMSAVNHFVVEAIAAGALKALPSPVVVGKGIDSLQAAVDELGQGVSAKKLIVEA